MCMSGSVLNARKADQAVREQEERDARIQRDLQATSEISSEQLEHAMKQLLDMFPNADPAFLEAALRKQDSNHLNKVIEQMMRSPYPKRRSVHDAREESAGAPPSDVGNDRQGGMFSNFRKRLAGQPIKSAPAPVPSTVVTDEPKGMPMNSNTGARVAKPATQATPFSDIKCEISHVHRVRR